jgi:tight adherence protein C
METLSQLGAAIGMSSGMLFVLLTGVTVFCLGAVFTGIYVSAQNPLKRRLSAAAQQQAPLATAQRKPQRDLTGIINPVARYILPQDGEERARAAENLIHAGFRSEKALPYYYGLKAVLALGLPLLVFIASRWLPQWTIGTLGIALLSAAFVGVILPNYVLDKIKENEAGLGLGAAIDRVARDLEVSHAELAEELRLVNVEMRAGIERPVALKNLADRTGLADIRGLVGLLVQTMRFGTSIADALRVYSEEFRDKRMQKAEEQAAKIGTKLIFPLVSCLFPAFFIVAVGPAVLRMIVVFGAL